MFKYYLYDLFLTHFCGISFVPCTLAVAIPLRWGGHYLLNKAVYVHF